MRERRGSCEVVAKEADWRARFAHFPGGPAGPVRLRRLVPGVGILATMVLATSCGRVEEAAPPPRPTNPVRKPADLPEPPATLEEPPATLKEPLPLPPEPTPRDRQAPSPSEVPAPSQAESTPEAKIEALRSEAREVATRLVDRFPESADAVALVGTVNDHQGRTAEAAKHWQRCVELDPGRADVYDGLGSIAMESGDPERAVTLWSKAAETDPRMVGIHNRLARALMSCGRTQEAIAALQRGIEMAPAAAEGHFLLGQAYLQSQEYRKAKTHYERALTADGSHLKALYGLGVVCARLGLQAESETYGKRFAELKARQRKGRMEHRSAFDFLVQTRRNVAQTHTDAGRIYRVGGDASRAQELWRRAAALDPDNWICRHELAVLWLEVGRRQEALEVCEEIRRIDSKEAVCYLNTGVLFARLRRFDAAEELLEKGVHMAPEAPQGYRSLARVLMAGGRKLPEAKQVARQLVALEPTAANYLLLGEACDRGGDASGALASLRKAAELDPGNEMIRQTLRRLQERP